MEPITSSPTFRRLLEAAPDAMVITDRQGRVVLINAQAEALFGYSRGELQGLAVEMLIPERYRAAHILHRSGYRAEPRTRAMGAGRLALFGLRKDGSEFPAEISLSPLETEEGPLAITAIRDITERKRAEEERSTLAQAQEAIRLRDDFLSIASHELKTPMTALHMQLDGVMRAAQRRSGEELRESVVAKTQVALVSVRRMTKLINQLLDVSRITAGRLTLQPEDVDVSELVRSVVSQFQDEMDRAGSVVRLHLPAGPLLGRWDPLRVEQILNNLLSNAIKYGQGRPIEVSLIERADHVRLMVQDHGIGIAVQDQRRIFDRFERVVSVRNFGGFGLGLWIVRQIIEAHGGSIQVWSEPLAGSTFTVDLPRSPVAAASGVAAAPQAEAAARKLLLVVDDDPLICKTFMDLMQEEGYQVRTAANGAEALGLLRAGLRPSLIFLDLMMPVMDGVTFRAEQRKDPELASIPVVVVSAVGDIARQVEGMEVAAYLHKPVNLDSLFQLAERYC